ncbi:MAG: anthranilate phosphoribosyltransferase [Thaumarchaeota archaeon]|jgi:anthranilate phosphoribosyltransferase|nr:anthranilate phosphoribosyltransferase [Candidatus Terraquivivens yellowstonensis]MCL7395431.1 anthranilate phosphoribosyltransferase [Candidatus Terraquivivens yellowstonensis]MCL7398325.1 anthranilate phosphoribosyltransferase [Candidatus Terraquivivens yellowstonensis]MCL7400773.1 anthranilate phosphoribosyltransferase [Candidatus Terraquivivens yellowstonensis]
MFTEILRKLVEGYDLRYDEAEGAMRSIMDGNVTNAQLASFLTAIRMKGETVTELTAFIKVMKEYCRKVRPKINERLVDVCGTGGDRIKTFNISTVAAFVIAGAGVKVAKHGNRAVSGKCGSADLLEMFGLNLEQDPKSVERAIEEIGIGFMYAPHFHPAMSNAQQVRKEIGIRTVFNLIGPLANPADVKAQLLGVCDERVMDTLIRVMMNLGCEEAFVVHGLNGLDEVSIIGKTKVTWLRNKDVRTLELMPKDFGVESCKQEELEIRTREEAAQVAFMVLNGENGPKKDAVLVNAALGIILGGRADDFLEGMELARESLDSGRAYKKLKDLIKLNGDPSKLERMEEIYG